LAGISKYFFFLKPFIHLRYEQLDVVMVEDRFEALNERKHVGCG